MALPPNTAVDKQLRRIYRPRIGIAGFYGYGNYGDELFLEVFRQWLSDEFDLEPLHNMLDRPYFSPSVTDRVENVDAIIVGGGDLVQPWNVDVRYFNKAFLSKPIFIAGVGVPKRFRDDGTLIQTDHTINRLSHFFQHENIRWINVRDNASANWIVEELKPCRAVQVSADIVCSLAELEPRVCRKENVLGIATRYRRNTGGLDDYSRLSELAVHAQSKGWEVRHLILGNSRVGDLDVENAANLTYPNKRLITAGNPIAIAREIGRCSALASMKFHGTVTAVMQGIPSIVLVQTSKNIEFSRVVGPGCELSQFDSDNLIALFDGITMPDLTVVEALRSSASKAMQKLRNALQQELHGSGAV